MSMKITLEVIHFTLVSVILNQFLNTALVVVDYWCLEVTHSSMHFTYYIPMTSYITSKKSHRDGEDHRQC